MSILIGLSTVIHAWLNVTRPNADQVLPLLYRHCDGVGPVIVQRLRNFFFCYGRSADFEGSAQAGDLDHALNAGSWFTASVVRDISQLLLRKYKYMFAILYRPWSGQILVFGSDAGSGSGVDLGSTRLLPVPAFWNCSRFFPSFFQDTWTTSENYLCFTHKQGRAGELPPLPYLALLFSLWAPCSGPLCGAGGILGRPLLFFSLVYSFAMLYVMSGRLFYVVGGHSSWRPTHLMHFSSQFTHIQRRVNIWFL